MQQKLQLGKAFEACRWVYNRCAETVNGDSSRRKDLTKDLRAKFVNVAAWTEIVDKVDKEWKDIPYEVRDGALRDAVKAVESADALMDSKAAQQGKDRASEWKLKFRRKKDITESIQLRHRDLNSKSAWFSRLFGTGAMRSHQELPKKFENDVRLVHDKRLREYFLVIPMAPPPKQQQLPMDASEDDSQALADVQPMDVDVKMVNEEDKIVSIDPGVRTFMTCFDPSGFCTKWGERACAKLWSEANTLHAFIRKMNKPGHSHRTLRHMRAVRQCMELRIRHLVDELHHKTAVWLCKTYKFILLPKFDTKQMAEKRDGTTKIWKRKITKKTVSQLYSLAHYRFRQFLMHKAREHGVTVFLVNEAYTTKTCSCCGKMHFVGASEVFRCPFCKARIDRDVNASINILLKFIHDNHHS
jgi:IS605 OrfB family transposase